MLDTGWSSSYKLQPLWLSSSLHQSRGNTISKLPGVASSSACVRCALRISSSYFAHWEESGMAATDDVDPIAESNDVQSDFQDRSITCIDCNEAFTWTAGEQIFFHDKGLRNEPKRCKRCKQAKNERLAAVSAAQSTGVKQRIEVMVTCAQCGSQTTVPFYPSQGRPVYCRSCFLAGHTKAARA